jgi:hypothetical protein
MDVSSEKKDEVKEYNGCSIATFVYSFGSDRVYLQIEAWKDRGYR